MISPDVSPQTLVGGDSMSISTVIDVAVASWMPRQFWFPDMVQSPGLRQRFGSKVELKEAMRISAAMISRAALASWFVVTFRSIPVAERCPDTMAVETAASRTSPTATAMTSSVSVNPLESFSGSLIA